MRADINRYKNELGLDPTLVNRVSRDFPPMPAEPERLIRSSAEHCDRAICRAIARAAMHGQVWRVDIEGLSRGS